MKIKVELIIDVDPVEWGMSGKCGEFLSEEEKIWFEKDVLNPANLVLHSNEPGDQVGTVTESSFTYIK